MIYTALQACTIEIFNNVQNHSSVKQEREGGKEREREGERKGGGER
jgi:hypothetical protein